MKYGTLITSEVHVVVKDTVRDKAMQKQQHNAVIEVLKVMFLPPESIMKLSVRVAQKNHNCDYFG